MKRFGRTLGQLATVAAVASIYVVTIWEDREQLVGDLREFKQRWVSPGRKP